MTPTQICSHCGAAAESLTAFDGQLLCPDCLELLTATCADCGGRFWRRDCRGNDEAAPVCYDCFRQNYVRCTRCGHAVHTDNCWYPLDNDAPYCSDCCTILENTPIHDSLLQAPPHLLRRRPPLLRRGAGDRRRR